jgi:hypothetical protein
MMTLIKQMALTYWKHTTVTHQIQMALAVGTNKNNLETVRDLLASHCP